MSAGSARWDTQAAHWIGGQWLPAGPAFASTNPADGTLIGHALAGGAVEARAAIDAARQAFDATPWRHSPRLRAQVLLDMANRDRILGLVEQLGERHRLVVRGGPVADLPAHGAFVSPTLVEVDDPQCPAVQDEHFAPLMTLEAFDDDRGAVALANATLFGLGASVWSRDGTRAQRIAREIRCGAVWINAHNELFAEAEVGGYKERGFGRLHGAEGMHDFLEIKHVYQKIGSL